MDRPTIRLPNLPFVNPGENRNAKPDVAARKRIPMSAPRQKLWVPEIPGFHCYWFNDDAGRIESAMQAGYEFVRPSEVHINQTNVANDVSQSGSTDEGDRVSIVVGEARHGGPQRAYLMKIPLDWFLEDQAALQARNDAIADAIKRGRIGQKEDGADAAMRYVKKHERTTVTR